MTIVGVERRNDFIYDESVRGSIIIGEDLDAVFQQKHPEGTAFYAYLEHFSEADKRRLWQYLSPILFYLQGAVAIVTEIVSMPPDLFASCQVTHYTLPCTTSACSHSKCQVYLAQPRQRSHRHPIPYTLYAIPYISCPHTSSSHPALTHPALTHPALTHPALATCPALTHPALTHPALTSCPHVLPSHTSCHRTPCPH